MCDTNEQTMTSELTDQLALSIRGILRVLHMPEVAEEDLLELISRLSQVSK